MRVDTNTSIIQMFAIGEDATKQEVGRILKMVVSSVTLCHENHHL